MSEAVRRRPVNRLSVIIPSRNADNLAACVRAVRQYEPDLRIIVVDDGVNWDRYISLIPDMVQSITGNVVDGVKPFVFARNVNRGITAAGTDDVVLLNDDALITTFRGFSELQIALSDPWRTTGLFFGYGIISPAINNVGNPNQFLQPPGARSWARIETRMLCFACVLIPRRTIDLVGLLDERYTGYGLDDDDYSLRVRRAGLRLGVYDGCFVDHGSLKSSYRGDAGAGGDFMPNMKIFIEKWGIDNWGHGRSTSQFRALFPSE